MSAKKPKEWTRNRGKMPVDASAWVEIRYRDGSTVVGQAGAGYWKILGKDSPLGHVDIMAWRRTRKPNIKSVASAAAPKHKSRDELVRVTLTEDGMAATDDPIEVSRDIAPDYVADVEPFSPVDADKRLAIRNGLILLSILAVAATVAVIVGCVAA